MLQTVISDTILCALPGCDTPVKKGRKYCSPQCSQEHQKLNAGRKTDAPSITRELHLVKQEDAPVQEDITLVIEQSAPSDTPGREVHTPVVKKERWVFSQVYRKWTPVI